MEHSVKDITSLPNIQDLKNIAQSLALLDAVLNPEWEYRYFSFNATWSENEMMASMRDGCGNEYFILFCPHGVSGKVFFNKKREKKALEAVPTIFKPFKSEKAFKLTDITYLLRFLEGDVKYYHDWAEDYYERKINYEALRQVYCTRIITPNLLEILNPNLEVEDLVPDLKEILG